MVSLGQVRRQALIWAAVSEISFCGCGTLVNGPYQPVGIRTAPTDALCTLDRKFQFKTPAIVSLRRNSGHEVQCDKDGLTGTASIYNATTDGGLVLGNILFGLLPGIVTDLITGGPFRFPSTVDVPMIKQ